MQGKAVWSEFAPILGKGKKEGIGNQYLPKGTLTDAKNVCRLNTGSEQPVKSLKSPQCGDFLQTLVKSGRHWFVAMKRINAKIPLEKRRFCTGAGTSSVPKFTKGE